MKLVRDYMTLFGIAGAIIALDQCSKYIVRSKLSFGASWSPFEWLAPYARFVHWNNTGAAFGIFPQGSMIFTIVAIVVSLAIIFYFPRVPSSEIPLRLALGLQLGGAVGNLISRLSTGAVTDFISLGSFPVFNVADSSISIGVAVLLVGMLFEERAARRESAAASAKPLPSETGEASGEAQIE
ncbi:MAG: signal peptidase II [Anaerolineales bacterium]|nr:signal peptidase II [Anaerolineales bacterium]